MGLERWGAAQRVSRRPLRHAATAETAPELRRPRRAMAIRVWLSAGPQNGTGSIRPALRIARGRPASPPPGTRTVVNPLPTAPASRFAPARAR